LTPAEESTPGGRSLSEKIVTDLVLSTYLQEDPDGSLKATSCPGRTFR